MEGAEKKKHCDFGEGAGNCAPGNCARLCTYERPSRGLTPGTFLAQDGGIGLLLRFRGKVHGEGPAGFVTLPPS